jgi:hypothetical protein
MTGQYFGQKYFLTKQRRVRSATVRVPFDSVSVDIACLMPEQFSIWDSYRNVLLGTCGLRLKTKEHSFQYYNYL